MDAAVFPRAREEGTLVSQQNRMPVEIPMNFTASDREVEQRLAYFREDIGGEYSTHMDKWIHVYNYFDTYFDTIILLIIFSCIEHEWWIWVSSNNIR